jgi:type II secretory pathway predicted ATPase ExeA
MIEERKLLALYGLKYNPFIGSVPAEDLWRPPELDSFFFRVENLVLDGGFALISGDNGTGKSKALQMLANHLDRIGDVVVGVMERPQSKQGDWYRELGDLFGVDLSPVNRYGGFKALRARWRSHIKSTLFRPILLVDEAQETPTESLTELRLLSSAHFDSEALISAVLCGDSTLPERFRHKSLTALGSRIRTRLSFGPRSTGDLRLFLDHLLDAAGAPGLMTDELKETLIAHCAGNLRMLVGMCAELLDWAAVQERKRLDEQLYFEAYGRSAPSDTPRKSRSAPRT